MNGRIIVGAVKDLGGGKFSVRVNFDTGNPDTALSQTQTVAADSRDAAIEIAKVDFSRWLEQITAFAVRNMPPNMRN